MSINDMFLNISFLMAVPSTLTPLLISMTCDKATAFRNCMTAGNDAFLCGISGDVSLARRLETSLKGQSPRAAVLACCDSRVHVDRIFSASIGDLFTIRTAGNVIGNSVLGSIEYGVRICCIEHILVLGHKKCGAVDAAITGNGAEYILPAVEEIRKAIGNETDPAASERLNVRYGMNRLLDSPLLADMVRQKKLFIHGAVYDISTGRVEWIDVP